MKQWEFNAQDLQPLVDAADSDKQHNVSRNTLEFTARVLALEEMCAVTLESIAAKKGTLRTEHAARVDHVVVALRAFLGRLDALHT